VVEISRFKVPFILYADFESILKPVEKETRGRKHQKEQSYTEKINTYVPSGWCVLSKFAYGDVPDPIIAYRGEHCVENFV